MTSSVKSLEPTTMVRLPTAPPAGGLLLGVCWFVLPWGPGVAVALVSQADSMAPKPRNAAATNILIFISSPPLEIHECTVPLLRWLSCHAVFTLPGGCHVLRGIGGDRCNRTAFFSSN